MLYRIIRSEARFGIVWVSKVCLRLRLTEASTVFCFLSGVDDCFLDFEGVFSDFSIGISDLSLTNSRMGGMFSLLRVSWSAVGLSVSGTTTIS